MTSIYRNNFFFLSDGQNSFGNQMTAILVFHASFSISSNINTSISLPLPPSPLVFQLLEKKQFVILSWRGHNFSFLRNSPTFTHLFFLLERCKGRPFHKCDPGSLKTKTLDANRGPTTNSGSKLAYEYYQKPLMSFWYDLILIRFQRTL